MDQGVIRSIKDHYRRKTVRLYIKAREKDDGSVPRISILLAMKLLVSSWDDASKETIDNCFKKAGISESNQKEAIADDDDDDNDDDDDPFKDLEEEFDRLREQEPNAVQPGLSVESFLDVDRGVITTSSPTTDAPSIAEVMAATENNENEESSDGDDVEEICDDLPTRPSIGELEYALDVISKSSF